MSKRVGVLFSGGLDSTYLVWKNLKDGNSVVPIYVEIENNKVKTILEKNRVELLYKEFHNEFGQLIENINYSVTVSVKANEDSLHFKQVPIWMFTAVFCQGNMWIDEIQIGYVSNDDAIPYLDDFQNIYKSYQAICTPMKPLTFPITKMKKWQMAEELPRNYRRFIISCENATIVGSHEAEVIEYEPCCNCAPCKTIIATNYYETHDYPEYYRKAMTMHHVAALHAQGYKVIDRQGKEYPNADPSDRFLVGGTYYPYQLKLNFNQYLSAGISTIEYDSSECKDECGETMDDEICDAPVERKDFDSEDLLSKALKVPFKSEYKFFSDRYKLVDKDLPQTEK